MSGGTDERERNVKQRGYIVQELIDTEKNYVAQLQLVVDIFIEPLRQEKIIDNIDINEQFLNWEPILGLHKQLLEQLETGSDSLGDTKVGQIFINYSSFFKMYMQYLSNFEIALTRRAELMCKNRKFLNFLEKAEKDSRCRGMGIESFLVTPVQRIPRYRMLLEQILKYTPDSHADHVNLFNSLSKINDVAIANNEAIRERESKDMIMRIMMSIDAKTRVNLLDVPARIFIRESEMMRQCRRGKKKFKFWLFSDKILYGEENTTVVQQSKVYSLHREILLIACRVSNVVRECDDIDRAFMLESPSKSFIVWANSVGEKNEWISNIQRCILSERENWEIETGKVAPLWTPDAQSDRCNLCETEFSTFFRRHHCRQCGTLVCDSCSIHRILIPHVSDLPVRACDNCFEELAEKHTDHRQTISTESSREFSHFSLRRQSSSFMSSISRKGSVFGSILGIGSRTSSRTSTCDALKVTPKLRRVSEFPGTVDDMNIKGVEETITTDFIEEEVDYEFSQKEDSVDDTIALTERESSLDHSFSSSPTAPVRPFHMGSTPKYLIDMNPPRNSEKNEILIATDNLDTSGNAQTFDNSETSDRIHALLCEKYSVISISSTENPFRGFATASTTKLEE